MVFQYLFLIRKGGCGGALYGTVITLILRYIGISLPQTQDFTGSEYYESLTKRYEILYRYSGYSQVKLLYLLRLNLHYLDQNYITTQNDFAFMIVFMDSIQDYLAETR